MEDNQPKNGNPEEIQEPQIHVNELGTTIDSTVVVEEADRTVLLTDHETIIIPKETIIDLPPKHRERKVYAGMWGTTELVTVGVALLAILTTILLVVFLVIPAQKELSDNRARRDELENQLLTAKSRYGNITSTQDRVKEIVTSVDDFETRFLSSQTVGQTALYQQINGLIAAYRLTNTSGPDYAPLEVADPNRNAQQTDEKGRSKAISIYPGTYITMTLDGPYQNLRRFIREIETSGQFVVITAVELAPSENNDKQTVDVTKPPVVVKNQPQPIYNQNFPNQPNYTQPNNPQIQTQTVTTTTTTNIDRGKTHGETVTLHLEMAAYFRRPNFQPQAAKLEQ